MNSIMTLNIPEDWPIQKLGQIFEERKEKVSDKDFPPLSVTKNGIVPQMSHVAKSDDSDNRKRVCKGDFVINSRSDRKGSSGISEYDGSVSLISIVIEPRHGHARFLHYLLKSQAFQEEFYRFGHGIVADLWTTRFSEMKSIPLAIPSFETQESIAKFLDKETARIDRLVKKKTDLVGLLTEKRKNTISAAIIGNQKPYDSFSRKHYKIKFVADLISQKISYGDIDADYVGLEHIKSWTGEIQKNVGSSPEGLVATFKSGDVLFGKLRPNLAKVASPNFSGVCSTEALVLRPNSKMNSDYLKYSMLEQSFIEDVVSSTYGAKMPRASWSFIGSKIIHVPSIEDQKHIVSSLKERISKIDEAKQKTEESIKKVKNYRSSLITEAVTGQLDIESWKNRSMADSRLDKIEEEMAS